MKVPGNRTYQKGQQHTPTHIHHHDIDMDEQSSHKLNFVVKIFERFIYLCNCNFLDIVKFEIIFKKLTGDHFLKENGVNFFVDLSFWSRMLPDIQSV